MKKFLAFILSLTVVMSLSASAFAADASVPTAFNESLSDEHFVPMTREEYLNSKAACENISYEEAEKELDAKIAEAKAALPSTLSWSSDTSVDNHDTTFTSYGRVYKIYTHRSGLKMRYSVEAVKLTSKQGAQWLDLNSGSTWCQPEGSGLHNFNGSVTANLLSKQDIRMAVTGYFEIAESDAISMGLNLEFFSYSTSVGGTVYHRDNISDSHIERA